MKKIFAEVLALLAMSAYFATAAFAHQQPLESSIAARSDGRVLLTVTNNSRAPVTAMVAIGTRTITATGATDKSVRFFDSVLSPFGPKNVLPTRSYTFTFFGPQPPPNIITRDVQLKAAIFADGSSWGESSWVRTLLLRRSSALRYNREVLKLVEQAGSAGTPTYELEQELASMEETQVTAAQTVAERQMAQVACEDALLMLRSTVRADRAASDTDDAAARVRSRSRLMLRINSLSSSRPTPGP